MPQLSRISERATIEGKASQLANIVLEEWWNDAAKVLIKVGDELWVLRSLIDRALVTLFS